LNDVRISSYAIRRCGQRNLSPTQVAYILAHAIEVRRTGITFFILRRRDIPAPDHTIDQYAKLDGAVLLIARDGTLVTAYRHPQAYHRVNKKHKYRNGTALLSIHGGEATGAIG
jgi:hypothetical protein